MKRKIKKTIKLYVFQLNPKYLKSDLKFFFILYNNSYKSNDNK